MPEIIYMYALRAKDKFGFYNDFLKDEYVSIILNDGTEIIGALKSIEYEELGLIDFDFNTHKISYCDIKYMSALE